MLIHTNDQLENFYLKCQKHKIIAVDTEFYRVDTYYPFLCLIQLANNEETIIIDPLMKNIDLKILESILNSRNILKVFHAANQDLEIFFNLFKKIPINVVDTQICIGLLGFSDSLGYADSVNFFLKKIINKSYQFIDWRKRPLSSQKINYAVNDVRYLIPLYKKVLQQLKKNNIFLDISESHKKILKKKNYIKSPNFAWEKLKIKSPKKYKIKILKDVCKSRESLAKKLNIPVKRIVTDKEIKFISKKKTKNDQIINVIERIKIKAFRDDIIKILGMQNVNFLKSFSKN